MGLAEKDGTLTLKKRSVKKKKKRVGGGETDLGGREIGERRGSSQSRREGERRTSPWGANA